MSEHGLSNAEIGRVREQFRDFAVFLSHLSRLPDEQIADIAHSDYSAHLSDEGIGRLRAQFVDFGLILHHLAGLPDEQTADIAHSDDRLSGEQILDRSQVYHLTQPTDVLRIFQQSAGGRELDSEVRDALIEQLTTWKNLAKFATWLSIGLAIGAGLLAAFIVSAMTWGDLFMGSGLWEFSLILFALAVFVASPLTIFVVGRPLKGIDEWSPVLRSKTPNSDSSLRQ